MELEKYIGTWENKSGNRLEIKRKNNKSLSVSFFDSKKQPVVREYFNNLKTIDMHAELDYYGSSIEVELWDKGKGFYLVLLHEYMELKDDHGYYLAPGLARNIDDEFLGKYFSLFEPLDQYKKVE